MKRYTKKTLYLIITIIFFCSAIALLYLVPERNISEGSPYKLTSHNKDRKKILIFTTQGGGGNIAAAHAITEYLEPEFCVGSICVFSNLLQSVDFLNKLRWDNKSTIDSYNYLAQRNWHRLLNMCAYFGSRYYFLRKQTINKLFEQYLTTYKPDLVISVAPIINNNLLKVAKKLSIPFLLISSDLDISNYLFGIQNPHYDKFKIGLAYEDTPIQHKLVDHKIDERYVSYVGFPVKKAIWEPHNRKAIKKTFNIPEGKPVILLMMGSQGSNTLYEFSKQLAKIQTPVHIVIVLGKSNHLTQKLHRVWFPKHISHTIIGFTDRIPELMSVANLLITKSGSVTVNESIYAHVPMLLDGTSTVLHWESFNHDFVKRHGLGKIVKQKYQIPELVAKILSKKEQERIQTNFLLFDKKNPESEIKTLVKEIVAG